ncbi:MAG: hypothetical protein ACFFCS_26515 [Candidatus Hodarchaeota archaeon]
MTSKWSYKVINVLGIVASFVPVIIFSALLLAPLLKGRPISDWPVLLFSFGYLVAPAIIYVINKYDHVKRMYARRMNWKSISIHFLIGMAIFPSFLLAFFPPFNVTGVCMVVLLFCGVWHVNNAKFVKMEVRPRKRTMATVLLLISPGLVASPFIVDRLFTRTRFTSEIIYNLGSGLSNDTISQVQDFNLYTAGNWTMNDTGYGTCDFYTGHHLNQDRLVIQQMKNVPFHIFTLDQYRLVYNFTAMSLDAPINVSYNGYDSAVEFSIISGGNAWWINTWSWWYDPVPLAFLNQTTFSEPTPIEKSVVIATGILVHVAIQKSFIMDGSWLYQWFVLDDNGSVLLAAQECDFLAI